MSSLYEELGVTPSAPLDILRLAFKKRALIVHPDKGGTKEAFQRVMFAFEVLADSSSRERYDRQLLGFPCHGHTKESCKIPTKVDSTEGTSARQHGKPKAKRRRVDQARVARSAGCGASYATSPGETASRVFPESRATQPIPKPSTPLEAKAAVTKAEDPKMHAGVSTQTAKSSSLNRCNVLLERLVQTLHALPPLNRRQALQGLFTEAQRKMLESFMLASRGQQRPRDQNSSSVLCEQIDSSESSVSSNSSDSEDAESDGVDACTFGQYVALPSTTCLTCTGDQRMGLNTCLTCRGDQGMDETLALCNLGAAEITENALTDDGGVLESVATSGIGPLEAVRDVLEVDARTRTKSESFDRSSWSRTSTRGLYTFHSGPNAGKYCVGVGIDGLLVTTRRVRDLSVALDHLVVLTELKQHARSGMASTAGARLSEALSITVAKWGDSKFEDMGLSFNVQLYNNFWIGRVPLRTPNMQKISNVVEALDSLAPYIGNFAGGHSTISQFGLVELEAQWEEFKRVFSSLCGKMGHCTQRVLAMLIKLEDAHRPFRERQVASWNLRQMAMAERLHVQMLKWEKRVERCNRAAMARHDRLSQRAGGKHMTHVERLLGRIETLLRRWWRIESRKIARDQRDALRERARKERRLLCDTRAATRAALIASRLVARRAHAAREIRWRAMNRLDLTMADILERRWAPATESCNAP